MGGQVPAVLGGAGEVGVQAAAGGADVGRHAVQQPGRPDPVQGGEAVPGRAVLVDVEDIGTGGASGDGQVPARVPGEPEGDLLGVRSGVKVAVRGGGDLAAGLAGEHRPAAGGQGQ